MAILKMIGPAHRPSNGYKYKVFKSMIDYVLNPAKTGDGRYTGSQNCMCATALTDMIRTKTHYGKEPADEHDRIGYHFAISWGKNEQVTPEMALEITKQFCEKYLSEHEVVYSAHLDTEHMHTHICFNSIKYTDGMKYRYEDKDWEKIMQPILDGLCQEHGLHELGDDTGKSLDQYAEDRKNKRRYQQSSRESHSNQSYCNEKEQDYCKSDYIRFDIDNLISESSSMEEFEMKMRDIGYFIRHGTSQKYGPYMSVRNSGMGRSRKTYQLGADYSAAMIQERILAKNKPLPDIPVDENARYIFSKRIYRCRIYYKTQNSFLRRHYARMYRLGVIPKSRPHLSYKEVAAQIKELRKLEYQVKIITEHNVQSAEQVDDLISKQQQKADQRKAELKSLVQQNRPYKKELSIYQRMEDLTGAYLLFMDGNEKFQEEAEEYLQLKKQADSFGHTYEELDGLQNSHKEKCKEIRSMMKEDEIKLNSLQDLSKEFEDTQKQYEMATNEELMEMDPKVRNNSISKKI